MTDQELADALYQASISTGEANYPWIMVARKARELLGPTPEEREVIKLAEAWGHILETADGHLGEHP